MDASLMSFMDIFGPYMQEVFDILPTYEKLKNADTPEEMSRILDESRDAYNERNKICQEK